MEKTWHYLENQFTNVTEKSYKRALIISNYHDAALKTAMDNDPDPDYAMLYNRYNPLHLALLSEYTTWKNVGGVQQGATLNLDQLLGLMTTKLNNWEPQVQVVYAKNTQRYKEIFPGGRKPFSRGNKDTRIEAVKTLSANIGNDVSLAAIKTEVDIYYTDLSTARDHQAGTKTGTKMLSANLEKAVADAMLMQYRNLGFLINKWAENIGLIAPFFDVQTIREREQRIFTGTLDPAENEAILIHTFMLDDELRLKIEGAANAKFYLASEPNGTDSTAVEITGNHEQTIKVSQFAVADYHHNRYLTVVNQSNIVTTKYLVEVY